jgi:hypothetical protein
MKIGYFIIAIVLLYSCNSAQTQEQKKQENKYRQEETAFSEVYEILKKDNGQLWNYSLQGPILLVNRDSRLIVANEPDNNGELTKQGNVFTGKFPEDLNIANSAINWNGKRWTIVALPLPDTRTERLDLLIHESFHRIQPFIGFDSLHGIQSNHLNKKNGRVYLKLEFEALKEALNSDTPEIHLKNALMFRLYRFKLFENAKESENTLEINEGLAEYTATILNDRTEKDLKNHYYKKLENSVSMQTYVRSFAYYTIPVYGFFMHKKEVNWNLHINRKSNLTDYISNFYGVDSLYLNEESIQKIGLHYGIDSIFDFENKRELEANREINLYKSRFLSDSVFSIPLIKMNIGFNPSNILPIDSLGTVYPFLRITDEWGILKVDSFGALIDPNWSKVTVSYPQIITDSLITGKGWELRLNESWDILKEDMTFKLTEKHLEPNESTN